jgi:hypothetical protein
MMEYRLSRGDLIRQIHRAIREQDHDLPIDSEKIEAVVEDTESGYIFRAGDFAEKCGIEDDNFVNKIQRELGVEFEKNLHDKFYFRMTRQGENLIFTLVES